jgi:hypothetical protein
MNPTDANTFALNINTTVVVIGTLITLIFTFWGYTKYKGKNVIKNTENKKGNISQSKGDNILDNVDNEEGTIIQK